MALNIFWEDENGETLEVCPGWFDLWNYINDLQELEKTCCLQFLDAYGDTTFNQFQIPVLITEFRGAFTEEQRRGG